LKKVSKTPKPKKCFKANKICILRIHASRPVTTCVKIGGQRSLTLEIRSNS